LGSDERNCGGPAAADSLHSAGAAGGLACGLEPRRPTCFGDRSLTTGENWSKGSELILGQGMAPFEPLVDWVAQLLQSRAGFILLMLAVGRRPAAGGVSSPHSGREVYSGQRAAGARSITISENVPGRTGALCLPGPVGVGPNFAETMYTRWFVGSSPMLRDPCAVCTVWAT
jgi:hypothetical protein